MGHRKATIAKIEAANIREQVGAAELAAEKVHNAGKKLGKDVLEEFMHLFAGMAVAHQPLPAGTPISARPAARRGEVREVGQARRRDRG